LYGPSHSHCLLVFNFTALLLFLSNVFKLQGPVKQSVEGHNTGLDWKSYSPSLSVSFRVPFSHALVGNTILMM